jgi:hypothetical protein
MPMTEPAAAVKVFSSSPGTKPTGTIAICVRDHINTSTFMSALHNDWSWLNGRGVSWLVVQGSMLVLQRNECLRQMEGDWILFIDDDMVWQPDTIGKLVASWEETQAQFEEPIIMGALCARRESPHDPTTYMRDSQHSGKYRLLEKWDTDLVEVDATGMAFVLVPKAALMAMTDDTFPIDKETRLIYDPPRIFRWTSMGEDLHFCQDAKKAGCRIIVDTRLKIGHVTEHVVTHDNFLQNLADRSQEDEDMVRAMNDKHGLPTMTAEEARNALQDRNTRER